MNVVLALRSALPVRAPLAVRAAISVAIPLLVGLFTGHTADGAAASFGSLAALYVPNSPYRYRARVVAAVALGLTVSSLVGGVAAEGGRFAVFVAVGVVAGVASFVCQAAQLPPPRELMPVMAAMVATAAPGSPVRHAGLVAVGGVVAWVVAMAPAAFGRARAPEERAVAGAFATVADLLDALGTTSAGAARHRAVLAVGAARAAVGQGAVPESDRLAGAVVAVEVVLEAALHVEAEASGPLGPEWAAAARGGPVPDGSGVVGGKLLASALEGAAAALAGRAEPVADRELPSWPGLRARLAAAGRRHSVVGPAAARFGVIVAAGVGLGSALGLSHAYWVGLTAAATLQGSNLVLVRRRLVHRLVGTAIGIGLAAAVLGWGAPAWVAVVAAIVFQCFVELTVAVHYGLAVVAITVLALALFHLSAPGENVAAAIGARLLDTAIGVALVLVLRRVLWPRATSARLPFVQARTLRQVARVLAAAWARDTDVLDRRRALQAELTGLRNVHEDALGDVGPAYADARWPVTAQIEELAFLALSVPSNRRPPPPEAANEFLARLDELADRVETGSPGPDSTLVLPGHPRTSAAATALAAAVSAGIPRTR